MRRALPNVLPWLVLVGASTATFFIFQSRESGGTGWSWSNPTGHFWIVSAAALLCAVLANAAAIAGRRTANWRVTLISLSFIAMAGIFSVDGLATPGFIVSSPSRVPAATSPMTAPSSDAAGASGYWSYGDYGSDSAYGAPAGTAGPRQVGPRPTTSTRTSRVPTTLRRPRQR